MMGGLISKVMEGCVTPDVRMSTAAGVVQVRAGAVSSGNYRLGRVGGSMALL